MALSTPASIGGATARSYTEGIVKKGSDVRGKVVEGTLLATLALSLLILLVLLVDLIRKAWSVLSDRPREFLGGGLNSSDATEAGVWQGIVGTVMLSIIVVIVAVPLGIACAVYLEEYAWRSRFAKWTRINVRNLAGVPSIVYGLLGLAIFVKTLDGINGNGRTVIAGGLALSALVLPIVIITASEALRAVPRSIREGAFGVGATQWETVRSHVLPSAAPGILTGTMLSLARAAGEAAPVLLVGAITGLLRTGDQGIVDQLSGPFTAMPVVIFAYARQPGDDFREIAAAASVVLLVLVLAMNGFAIWLRNRYERKW
jgi:phosphate transport system permease protein